MSHGKNMLQYSATLPPPKLESTNLQLCRKESESGLSTRPKSWVEYSVLNCNGIGMQQEKEIAGN